jgi:methionyl-tRNA formyltransferase
MPIQENETAGELHDRMMHLGAKTVVKTIELIRKGNVQTQPQPDRSSKPAPKIYKSD